MESNPVVFDISSDDDEATPAWSEDPKGDDYDWWSEVLQYADKGFDDPDEVVVVGEVNNPNKKTKQSTVRKTVRKEVDDDDDECVVLDGDPDKGLSDVNDFQEDSDDLVIVSQKGQIACRDFPHPRHDCAKLPFSSTSHEQHCELCHCFVCDTCAPCLYWGSGVSKDDHCHATDKEELWKTLRKTFRQGGNVPLPVSRAPVISQSTAVLQVNQAPPSNIIRLSSQNQVSRPTPAHNIIRLTSQNQVSQQTQPSQNQVSQPTLTLQNQVSGPTSTHDIIWPTLQNQVSRPTLTSENQVSRLTPALQNQVSRPTTTADISRLTSQNQASGATPTHNTVRLPSQNQVSRPTPTRAAGHYIPQSHVPRPSIIRPRSSSTRYGIRHKPSLGSRHVLNKNTAQPCSVSQQFLGVHNTVIQRDRGIKISNLGSQFVSSNTMSKRLDSGITSAMNQTVYVPSGNGTSAHAPLYQQNSLPAIVPNYGNGGGLPNFCSGTNLGTFAHQSSLQPRTDCVFTISAPSQSSLSQPLPHSNGHPVGNQLQNQNQSATNYGSENDFNWVNNAGQSNQQSSVDLPLQTRGSINEEQPFNEVSMREIESLLLENQTVPENPVTAEYGALSPDPSSFDTGVLFFDIDTSWDRLTRA